MADVNPWIQVVGTAVGGLMSLFGSGLAQWMMSSRAGGSRTSTRSFLVATCSGIGTPDGPRVGTGGAARIIGTRSTLGRSITSIQTRETDQPFSSRGPVVSVHTIRRGESRQVQSAEQERGLVRVEAL
jgi:hypothetical protein